MHALGLQFGGLQYKGAVLAKVARSKRRKNAKLVKKRQITSTNAKQAETSQMLLVLTFPDD